MTKEETLKRISEVIKIDATIPAKSDFLASHTPFKNIKFTKSGRSAEHSEYITEDQLFNYLFESDKEQHRFVVVQGDNGSGKSHLIRWLKEKYEAELKSDDEVILFISRKQSTLKGAIEQLLNSDVFPEEWKNSELKKLFKASEALDDDLLKKNIIHQFSLQTEKDENGDENFLRNNLKKQLKTLLLDTKFQTFLLKEDGPINRIKDKLNPEDKTTRKDEFTPYFKPEDFYIDINFVKTMRADAARPALFLAEEMATIQDGPEMRKSVSSYLNTKLDEVIQTCTNLSAVDLRKLFDKVRVELKKKDKNLILFIEDITSFTGIDKALVEVLIVEHQSEGLSNELCKICSIIGITNAFFEENLQDNIKDRITDRVILDKAILNNIDELSEMAARYINAINQPQDIFNNWILNKALQKDLPVLKIKEDDNWASIKTSGGKEFSIFPFNKESLQMMYPKLQQQTPRRFIQDIILYIYKNYLKNDDFPDRKYFKEFSPRWKNPLHEAQLKRIDGKNFEKIATLITVWGNGTLTKKDDNGVELIGGLSEKVFKSFRLPFISVTETDTSADSENVVETTQKAKEKETTEKLLPTKQQEDNFISVSNDIEDWYKGEVLKGFQNIRDALVDFIFTFIDWDSENVSHQIVQDMLPTSGSIGIEGHVFSKANVVYVIRKNQKSRFALLAIAAYLHLGDKSWNFPDSADYQLKLADWVLSIKDELISSICLPRNKIEIKSWPIIDWAILSDFYVNIIAGNFNTNDKIKDIYVKILNPEIIEQNDGRSADWNKFSNQLIKKDLKGNNKLTLNYFNCIQGEVTRITNIFFLDAHEILEVIQNYYKNEFDFEKIDTLPDSTKMPENILSLSLSILNFIKTNINQVMSEEINNAKNILEQLNKIFGEEITKDAVAKILNKIKMLHDILLNTHEIFNQSIFNPFIENEIDKNDLIVCLESYKKINEVKDYKNKLFYCSSLPVKRMERYCDIFITLNNFLENKLDNLSDIGTSVDSDDLVRIVNNTKTILNDLHKNITDFYE